MKNEKLRKERDSNIELLRIVLMFMIVLFHLVIHGCDFVKIYINSYDRTGKDHVFSIITSSTAIAVNCFVFISGYYGIKFKAKTLISFLVQGLFYSVAAYLLLGVLMFDNKILSVSFIKSIFPLSTTGNTNLWFFGAYIGLYVLSPLINKGTDSLSKYQLGGLIIVLVYLEASHLFTGDNFFSGDGYNLYTITVIYIIARFFKRFEISIQKPFALYILITLLLSVFITFCLSVNRQSLAWRITIYNCPLIIFGAISFFFVFKNLKIKSKIINKIAPLVFGVYLIHENPYVSQLLYSKIRVINSQIDSSLLIFFVLLLIAICVFVICACIEKIRQKIFNPLVDFIYDKTMTKIFMTINKSVKLDGV